MAMNRQYATINGEQVDVTTVMDTTVKFNATAEMGYEMRDASWKLLDKYLPDRLNEGTGFYEMFGPNGAFWENKGWLIKAMEKSPYYNGRFQIILSGADMSRGLNTEAANNFFRYAFDQLNERYMVYKNTLITYEEARIIENNIDHTKAIVYNLYNNVVYCNNRVNRREYRAKLTRILNRLDSSIHDMYKRTVFKYDKQVQALKMIQEYINEADDPVLADENCAAVLSFTMGDKNFVRKGQKITKIVNKICRTTPIVNHSDVRDVSFFDANDNYIQRTKDLGWNYQYAAFADALSPLDIKGTAVISVHPIDYYTMSFLSNGKASCHTIDKSNLRHSDHHYSGCYCGGTESYMLDKHAVIFYYLPEGWNGDYPEKEDKLKRCVFFIGEDKLIQSRLYPDGRDGGDAGVAVKARHIMQKVVSELFDVPNYWTVKKGTEECMKVINTCGVQYPDYEYYEDCNVSYLKRIDGYTNGNTLDIGEAPICPECGERHDFSENVFCSDCAEGCTYCDDCGSYVRRENAIYIGGYTYCRSCVNECEDCNHYTRDELTTTYDGTCVCDWCLNNRYTWSEYDNDYIDDYNVVTTEEGNSYAADSDGYMECGECGELHDADNMVETEDGRHLCLDCYEREQAEEIGDEE